MTLALFGEDEAPAPAVQPLSPGAVVLRGWARPKAADLLAAVQALVAAASWRHMHTPGGHRMSVALTNAGALGWVSDATGYRYDPCDPATGLPWPALPDLLRRLAGDAAAAAGFSGFVPDACLINRYVPGARLALHPDRNERDLRAPIVSVSLGLPAVFLWGGLARGERPQRVPLWHGDVAVWGGPSRLRHHGVLALRDGHHPLTGACRINLTLRRAG